MNSSIFKPDLFGGKVILVTGGGSGIGAGISNLLLSLGATVIIASRKPERIEKAVKGLRKMTGGNVEGRRCDIRDRESVNTLVDGIIKDHQRIDVLINNGGGQFFSPAEHIRDKGWDSVLATNLTGTWNLTKAVASAYMLKNGGRIVNITMLTDRGFPGMAHSCAARSGVEGMSKTLAIEWAQKGITVNCIQPGIIASNGMSTYPGWKAMATQALRTIPMKRLGGCDDVAQLTAFLASPAGAYITGQIWTVDGGRNLWGDTWPIADPRPLPDIELEKWPWE